MDRAQNRSVVAAGKVGAADGSGEEGVACDEQIQRSKVQADASGCVAGSVQHLRLILPEADYEMVLGAGIGRRDLGCGEAEPSGLRVHHFEQGQVVLVEEDGRSGLLFQFQRAANVVDVRVRDNNLFEPELVLFQTRYDLRDVAAGIDDHGLAGRLIAKDRAVTLQHANGKGLEDHTLIVYDFIVWGLIRWGAAQNAQNE